MIQHIVIPDQHSGREHWACLLMLWPQGCHAVILNWQKPGGGNEKYENYKITFENIENQSETQNLAGWLGKKKPILFSHSRRKPYWQRHRCHQCSEQPAWAGAALRRQGWESLRNKACSAICHLPINQCSWNMPLPWTFFRSRANKKFAFILKTMVSGYLALHKCKES